MSLTGSRPIRRISPFSPSGLVPCLHDGDIVVWDSMAIAGHLAERHPRHVARRPCRTRLGAGDQRRDARGIRGDAQRMAMCIRERVDVRPWSKALDADIARVVRIWDESRRRFGAGGAFLCGRFSIADCFYGPVAFRFQTYGVRVDGVARGYLEALLAHPFMQEWERAALAETTIIEADEPRLLYRDKIAAADVPVDQSS